MESLLSEVKRRLAEVAVSLVWPILLGVCSFLISAPFLLWSAIGLSVGLLYPRVKQWHFQDQGKRMFTDIQFAAEKMDSLFAGQIGEDRKMIAEWWLATN